MTKQGTERLCPAHLRDLCVPTRAAAAAASRTAPAIEKAIRRGRLKAIPMPFGTRKRQYLIRLGDLVEYTRRPLLTEWLVALEQNMRWQPGQEVSRSGVDLKENAFSTRT